MKVYANTVFGCNKLELEEFKEVTSCKGFVCADNEGYEKYIRREKWKK